MNAKLNSAIARVSRRLRFKLYDNEDAKAQVGLNIRFCNKQFRSRILGNCQLFDIPHQPNLPPRNTVQPAAARHRRTRSSIEAKALSKSPSSELSVAGRRGTDADLGALQELKQSLNNLQRSSKHLLKRCSSDLLALKRSNFQWHYLPPKQVFRLQN